MAKNIMRKILPMIAGIGVVTASASTVVSCTAPQYAAGEDGQRMVVSTDGGHINDHSFNQDAYLGVKNFESDAYDLNGKNNYVEAGGTDQTSIISGYRMSILKKANVVVTPGFSHVNTLPSILPDFKKNHINTILVDGIVNDPSVISIQFNSQIAGFMAGYDTSFLMGTSRDANGKLIYDVNGDGNIRMGTFAGASNKYGVDNYMWGLLLGMQVYDDVLDANKDADWAKNAVPVYSANLPVHDKDKGNIKDISISNSQNPDWWTNSFDLGGATKVNMPAKLIEDKGLNSIGGADVIFPVAGPQIQDVLTYNPTKGRAPYVIGVDVDQEGAYSDYQGRFITSAIKNIDTAVPEAAYRAFKDNDFTSNTLKPKDGKYKGDAGAPADDKWVKTGGWLGTSPEPFVNWSIDFIDSNFATKDNPTPPNKYLLKQHYISLYGDDVESVSSGAMKEINDHFASLGDTAPYYMNGADIYTFAQSLVKTYSATVQNGVLDWYKPDASNTPKD